MDFKVFYLNSAYNFDLRNNTDNCPVINSGKILA